MVNVSKSGSRQVIYGASVLALAAVLALGLPACRSKPTASAAPRKFSERDAAESRAAFLAAYPVFIHPRCMNCHPTGNVPLQGDESHPHAQNVQRGPDGKGLYALKWANCHQSANLPGLNMPPGNPNWHMLPPQTPMVFQGKTPADLARQLKDLKQNGNRTLEQLIHHVSEDKLVLGGWNPGDGRTKPPLSHDEFAAKMREWIEKGAAIPE